MKSPSLVIMLANTVIMTYWGAATGYSPGQIDQRIIKLDCLEIASVNLDSVSREDT
jgi:hypothetical protein